MKPSQLSADTIAFIRATTDDHPFPGTATHRAQLVALRTEVLIYRNMLLKIARECAGCGGTGRVPTPEVLRKVLGRSEAPCSDCADIRKVLA